MKPLKPNTGTLSANQKKDSANHPDLKGRVSIDGTEYWLSGWNKSGDYGSFISLAVTKMEAAKTPPIQQVNERPADLDDSIPF